MNTKELATIVAEAQINCPGLDVIRPGTLSATDTATHLIKLLSSTYVKHGITQNPGKVAEDIENGNLTTWLAKKDGCFVATASLVKQVTGDVEIGRAVSRSKGAGKLLMVTAVLDHLQNHVGPLIAEVRVATEFGAIPSGEATQHICFGLLELVPHAIAPFFIHGSPPRSESFVLARNDMKAGKTVSELTHNALRGRSTTGRVIGLRIIQREPFNIALPDDGGSAPEEFAMIENLALGKQFTLFPIEVTDINMGLIGALSNNPRMILCGIQSDLGKNNKPIVLFGTIGAEALIAPSKITGALEPRLQRDLQSIADSFTRLGGQNI